MKIIISNTLGIPIYEQIKEQIKTAILAGELSEGDALPSIRILARDLKISVITTTRAYNDLEQEGFVANVQGKGCYVLGQNEDLLREQVLCKIENNFISAITVAKTAKISKDDFCKILEILMEDESYE